MASTVFVTPTDRAHSIRGSVTVTDALLIAMALIWGVNFIVVKYATSVFAPLAFNSTRIALGLVVLWVIFLARRMPLPSRRDALAMLALGVLGNGFYQILWIEGMARTRASDAAVLVAASPAFIEIIGWMRGQERLRSRGIAGIAISLAGIGFVVFGAAHGSVGRTTWFGIALILGSILCWAVYAVGLKPLTERTDGLTLSAVTMTGGMIPMLILAVPSLRRTQWHEVGAAGWAAVGYAGILALVVAYTFWYRGVRVLGPTRASMYSNLQPLFAMAAAWALLGESPRALQVLGGMCIIGGLLLTRLPGRRLTVPHE